MTKPHIVLCLAGRRGLRFLEHCIANYSDKFTFSVFTCPESDDKEPRFTEDIKLMAWNAGYKCGVYKRIEMAEGFWKIATVDLLFAVGWRYLIPKETYSKAKLGAFVFHDSLLPKYRGFAPTVRAMINGEYETGVSLIDMVEEVDAGDIIAQHAVHISCNESIAEVMYKVTESYLDVFDDNIQIITSGKVYRTPQKFKYTKGYLDGTPSYSPKMMPRDYYIDWNWSTERIDRFIRAVTHPYPGAKTMFSDISQEVTILKATPYTGKKYVTQIPGRVIEKIGDNYVVMTGDGALLIEDYSPNSSFKLHDTLGK